MPAKNGTPRRPSPEQPAAERLSANTNWFHVFQEMVFNGDLAKMGPSAGAVYLVIKSHVNFTTGQSFPSVHTMAQQAGISERQVSRALTTLVQHGYLHRTKRGRHNLYTLREKIPLKNQHGDTQALATWDYLPETIQATVHDLKNVLLKGQIPDGGVIFIEHLNVNMQVNTQGGQGVQHNAPASHRMKGQT